MNEIIPAFVTAAANLGPAATFMLYFRWFATKEEEVTSSPRKHYGMVNLEQLGQRGRKDGFGGRHGGRQKQRNSGPYIMSLHLRISGERFTRNHLVHCDAY